VSLSSSRSVSYASYRLGRTYFLGGADGADGADGAAPRAADAMDAMDFMDAIDAIDAAPPPPYGRLPIGAALGRCPAPG
jgi:hypothetical protein